jgi:hypothetical protein
MNARVGDDVTIDTGTPLGDGGVMGVPARVSGAGPEAQASEL